MEQVTLTIDGTRVTTPKGTNVLRAARAAGIYVPALCYDPDLSIVNACRLCVVEVQGMDGMPQSCDLEATEGMVVNTITPAIREVRKRIIEVIKADHANDCMMCPKNEHCELQLATKSVNVEVRAAKKLAWLAPTDASNPFFTYDLRRCILCYKCVRVCDEVVGAKAIEMQGHMFSQHVAPRGASRLVDTTCISCGSCLAKCPTAAILTKIYRVPTEEVRSTCGYCGVGCGIYLGLYFGQLSSVRGDEESPVNRGYLCAKGRFGIADFVNHEDRLMAPMVRKDDELTQASWDEALDLIGKTLAKYSKDEVAVIASAKCTNEDNYVIQKFARTVLGTNNIDHCARLCHAPTVSGLAETFGSGAMTNSIQEIKDAACIMAIGSNTLAAHPIIGMQVNQAVKKGANLIVINPREIDICRWATLWLRHRPGTDVALLMGIMKVIVDEGLEDKEFIAARTENYEAFKASLSSFGLDFVEKTTGVPREQIVRAARMYAAGKPASILYAMGITQHSHGTDNVMAIANLAMLTGNIGKPSSGVNPLRGQNNVQGSCDAGALPDLLPGYQKVSDPEVRRKFEQAWDNCHLDPEPGLTLTEIFKAAAEGKIRAMYLVGENPALSDPDLRHVWEGLENLEFLAVQDIFLNPTGRRAHVVLPACSFAERDGTFTNTERRVQRIRKAIEPVGESRPDWWITCQIAKKMGASGFEFDHPSRIMEEMAGVTPIYAGISYEKLEKGGIQWPCTTPEHEGSPILHTQSFTRGKGKFVPLAYRPPAEQPDKDYPLILTTERSAYQFHTGTMTRRVEGLVELRGEELVEMNPADAERLGVAGGDRVKVTSRRGEVEAKARVTEASPPGVISMTFHFGESPTNVLTGANLDPVSKIPELKVTAVRVEKVREDGGGEEDVEDLLGHIEQVSDS
ncbi:MAG: formate dehydrogenase subunit alpha [Chloroflexi bacterium]|nr:formate dehydrogenase subunit alpha [Chloroflexota bacterium]